MAHRNAGGGQKQAFALYTLWQQTQHSAFSSGTHCKEDEDPAALGQDGGCEYPDTQRLLQVVSSLLRALDQGKLKAKQALGKLVALKSNTRNFHSSSTPPLSPQLVQAGKPH